MAAPSVRVVLIRHAETDANLNPHQIGGQSLHTCLTALGHQQCFALSQRLRSIGCTVGNIDHIATSTARRTVHTAMIALGVRSHMIPNLKISMHADLLEQNQGDWEGKERSLVYTDEVNQRMLEEHIRFAGPGGESLHDVATRATRRLAQLLKPLYELSTSLNRTTTLVVFTHGGVVRSLIHSLLGCNESLTWRIQVDNTSITQLKLFQQASSLTNTFAGMKIGDVSCIGINDNAHLSLNNETSSKLGENNDVHEELVNELMLTFD